ncbi:MAG: 5-oxoprolinase (ATP-hydrolyzing) [Acidimicrobiaceae bacterium]|nr:MAG: 5-oxoprolinase (ATP-hydrolyzing) [Acidimicrobiaceae bacterium]
MRISVDIGGTFTDLVIETMQGLELFKAPTVPADPIQGVMDVLRRAAEAKGVPLSEMLLQTERFTHATTRALNAVLTRTTAPTAFLTTAGHPDVLLLREGGREDPFDFTVPYPEPYVPRSLTYEVPERISSTGRVLVPLDEAAVDAICGRLLDADVKAAAVCLLWSTVNPAHELRVGELLAARLPQLPVTLSHELNPCLREYRRASSAAIDASLKPIMTDYLSSLTHRLRDAGLAGKVLMVTSIGGVLEIDDVARSPIHAINSGPSMAPVAGRAYAEAEGGTEVVIVADAGGTTYDVTMVRKGHIPLTRDAWIGPRFTGHITGFPSIDVKSVGAGGGSIAWVDAGGLLHVGPRSAGSVPGPACYGRGGTEATVTDAALVLGYLDPRSFSDGAMTLEPDASVAAVRRSVGEPMRLGDLAAADAVIRLTTEQMVRAIEDITLQQGIDPARAVLIGGGGAAGLNAAWVAERLGCPRLLIPPIGAALAAAGALMSDLVATYALTVPTSTDTFDLAGVNDALDALRAKCWAFAARSGVSPDRTSVELFAEAHYPQQIWDLEVVIGSSGFQTADDVIAFAADFHAVHEQVLGVADHASQVEIVTWGARVRCELDRAGTKLTVGGELATASAATTRHAYFPVIGMVEVAVRSLTSIGSEEVLEGPTLIESAFTTVVVPPGMSCSRGPSGSLSIAQSAAPSNAVEARETVHR